MKLPTTEILSNLQGTRQRGGLDIVEYGKYEFNLSIDAFKFIETNKVFLKNSI